MVPRPSPPRPARHPPSSHSEKAHSPTRAPSKPAPRLDRLTGLPASPDLPFKHYHAGHPSDHLSHGLLRKSTRPSKPAASNNVISDLINNLKQQDSTKFTPEQKQELCEIAALCAADLNVVENLRQAPLPPRLPAPAASPAASLFFQSEPTEPDDEPPSFPDDSDCAPKASSARSRQVYNFDDMTASFQACDPMNCPPLEVPSEKIQDSRQDSFMPNIRAQRDEWLAARFKALQENQCKDVLLSMIRAIEPSKHKKFPYQCKKGDSSGAPPWWPKDLRHTKGPHHMHRDDRSCLLVHLTLLPLNDEKAFKEKQDEKMKGLSPGDPQYRTWWLDELRTAVGGVKLADKATNGAEDVGQESANAKRKKEAKSNQNAAKIQAKELVRDTIFDFAQRILDMTYYGSSDLYDYVVSDAIPAILRKDKDSHIQARPPQPVKTIPAAGRGRPVKKAQRARGKTKLQACSATVPGTSDRSPARVDSPMGIPVTSDDDSEKEGRARKKIALGHSMSHSLPLFEEAYLPRRMSETTEADSLCFGLPADTLHDEAYKPLRSFDDRDAQDAEEPTTRPTSPMQQVQPVTIAPSTFFSSQQQGIWANEPLLAVECYNVTRNSLYGVAASTEPLLLTDLNSLQGSAGLNNMYVASDWQHFSGLQPNPTATLSSQVARRAMYDDSQFPTVFPNDDIFESSNTRLHDDIAPDDISQSFREEFYP